MPSLIPGYEYDVFISYRQKDNKGDHWVSGFVENLRTELEAAFKEDISIYFDENPHDGLHEMHDVGGSLKEKIRCLIFIPILSRTYCDSKSFAWQHEFIPFKVFANQDLFGLRIRIPNGNVINRILPVRIYELSAEDRILFEKETGGPLRAIDFVFTSAGVNRPLLPADKKDDNLAHVVYRDQVNKIANVVGELVAAMQQPSGVPAPNATGPTGDAPRRRPRRMMVTWIAAFVILILTGIFVYKFSMNQLTPAVTDKSIAVLPFADISDLRDQAYFSDGMMVEILDHLFKIKDLRIIPRNTMLGYKDSVKPLSEIARELGVANLMLGSVRKSGNRVKISVQLIDGLSEQFIWQETYDRELADVFSVQSDVASHIAAALQATVTPEVRMRMDAIPTKNQEAYDLYLKGREEYNRVWEALDTDHVKEGLGYLKSAATLDSAFSDVYAAMGECYWLLAHYAPDYTPEYWSLSKENLKKAIRLDPNNGWAYSELAVVQHNWDWDKQGARQSLQKAVQLNPSSMDHYIDLWFFYFNTMNCDSLDITLRQIKSIEPGDHRGFGYEVLPLICAADTAMLAKMKAPTILWGLGIIGEVQRLLILRRYDEALVVIEANARKLPEEYHLVFKTEVFGMQGDRKKAEESVRDLEALSQSRHIWPTYFAIAYMAIGDEDRAYKYLEESIKQHSLGIHFLPYFVPFFSQRNDPKFQTFMKRTWVN